MRRLGLLIAALYVAAAFVSFNAGLLPAKPLYDGLAPPQPYRWVVPPPERANDNQPAEPATGRLDVGPDGFDAKAVSTPDGQASLIVPKQAIPAIPTETFATVKITPLSPNGVVLPAPLIAEGNVYRLEVRYGSGAPVQLTKPASIVLRYPVHATDLLLRSGRSWTRVPGTEQLQTSLQLFAETKDMGDVVAGAAPGESKGTPAWAYGAAGAGLAIASSGFLLARRRAKRRDAARRSAASKRPKGRTRRR